MKFNFLLVVIISTIVCGCATTPVNVNQAKAISQDRVYESYKKYSEKKESGARVIVVRDNGLLGSAGSVALFLNGEIIARVRTGESITLNVNGGDNVLGVGPGTKMGWEKDNTELIEQTLSAEIGKDYYFRITTDHYKGLVLQRSTQIN